MLPTAIPSTVPIPPVETWGQFPVVGVIVLCFLLAGLGLRWIWRDYIKERDKDRVWREEQNIKREAAVAEQNTQRELATAEQNRLWREAMRERDERWERVDQEKQGTLKEIAQATAVIISSLQAHDHQAKEIKTAVERIDRELTRPLSRKGGD